MLATVGAEEAKIFPSGRHEPRCKKAPPVKHGDLVLFKGPQWLYGLVPGREYRVFGVHPVNLPGPGFNFAHPKNHVEEISVYVDDPEDRVGGVYSAPSDQFEISAGATATSRAGSEGLGCLG